MSIRTRVARLLLIACAGGTAACATPAAEAPPPQTPLPPDACRALQLDRVPQLTLPRTLPPQHTDDNKSAPLQIAQPFGIGRTLTGKGRWQDGADGWSSLTLRLYSENARSLSIHLSGVRLPRQSELWYCSEDGRMRHGPYRDATGGELWTPVVSGERALIQVWVPTRARGQFEAVLESVQGGFR
ncbi:MAG: hypothetical protein PHP86_13260 [Nevskiales bacterium]|nr:hypothetical protein [Nevskiales bacterium]